MDLRQCRDDAARPKITLAGEPPVTARESVTARQASRFVPGRCLTVSAEAAARPNRHSCLHAERPALWRRSDARERPVKRDVRAFYDVRNDRARRQLALIEEFVTLCACDLPEQEVKRPASAKPACVAGARRTWRRDRWRKMGRFTLARRNARWAGRPDRPSRGSCD